MDSMIEHNGIELLVHRLTSLAESSDDEGKAVFNTLSIFENMVEVKPEVRASPLAADTLQTCCKVASLPFWHSSLSVCVLASLQSCICLETVL